MVYKIVTDNDGNHIIQTSLRGKALMFHPRLNKGNAFSDKERVMLGLLGKLPPVVESLATQVDRAYHQYMKVQGDYEKSLYLHGLFNTNEILFYALVSRYISEVTDKLYTPTVSESVKDYSLDYRQPRGLFISCNDVDRIDAVMDNRTNTELDMIVISDGEAILGIGDQGVGGMGIPVAKAAMHVVAGGVSPYRIAPLFVDVGTNNQALLSSPYYLGLKKKRLSDSDYQSFLSLVLDKIYAKFPDVVVHFEDFSKDNARWLMHAYGQNRPCFNDDIQGTAAIVLSAIMTALKHKNESILAQRIMLVGPGSAGLGIVESLLAYIRLQSGDAKRAASDIWLIGRNGVVTDDTSDTYLEPFAKNRSDLQHWSDTGLHTAVKMVKPTILIGVTGQSGLFDKALLSSLFDHVDKPIILPLSNPSLQSECLPQDVYDWFSKPFFMATGSPFKVNLTDQQLEVSQCNNLYAFPGIAAGMVACKAKTLSQSMIIAVAEKISSYTLNHYDVQAITPRLTDLSEVGREVALGLIQSACASGQAARDEKTSLACYQQLTWKPNYLDYVYCDSVESSSLFQS